MQVLYEDDVFFYNFLSIWCRQDLYFIFTYIIYIFKIILTFFLIEHFWINLPVLLLKQVNEYVERPMKVPAGYDVQARKKIRKKNIYARNSLHCFRNLCMCVSGVKGQTNHYFFYWNLGFHVFFLFLFSVPRAKSLNTIQRLKVRTHFIHLLYTETTQTNLFA